MKKGFVTIMLCFTGIAQALHVDLPVEKKIEFAQKRRTMMNARIASLATEQSKLKSAIAAIKKANADLNQLKDLEDRSNQVKNEMERLREDLTITENSIKALMAEK